ncbi:hypothetical protein B0J12DRAFT_135404 [Macrophomina phaseolina]|uniref:Uncharacterized protein n=1 Tax=Macrophomina phaseolina TaxID=35725 RepID=A0ABQ8G6X0_9PEZI|nr:hypothetical protein B0J12DRAFT_135404 [Macrophomina phaseolina]
MHARCGTEKRGGRVGAMEEWGISTLGVRGHSIALHCISGYPQGCYAGFLALAFARAVLEWRTRIFHQWETSEHLCPGSKHTRSLSNGAISNMVASRVPIGLFSVACHDYQRPSTYLIKRGLLRVALKGIIASILSRVMVLFSCHVDRAAESSREGRGRQLLRWPNGLAAPHPRQPWCRLVALQGVESLGFTRGRANYDEHLNSSLPHATSGRSA